mmetsp:Transcript_19970/g.14678  ORF Transcript_19970/g.14678 Transcript_19970/m.14678 type:complete len:187 (+) Transcript_19970:422-982(+)
MDPFATVGYGILNNCGGGSDAYWKLDIDTLTYTSVTGPDGIDATEIIDISAAGNGAAYVVTNIGALYEYDPDTDTWTLLGATSNKNFYALEISAETLDHSLWVLIDDNLNDGSTVKYKVRQFSSKTDTVYKFSNTSKARTLDGFDFLFGTIVDKDGVVSYFDVKILFTFSVNKLINKFFSKFIPTA